MIDNWVAQYPALQEIDADSPWFKGMMVSIARSLKKEHDYGLKSRILIGVSFSYFDMGSDCFMIYLFSRRGDMFYAYTTLGSVLLNLVFQSFVVFICNHKRGFKVVIRELFIVLTLMKPGVDAFRIATDEETCYESTMTQLQEANVCRVSETVFESIPASIILMRSLVDQYTSYTNGSAHSKADSKADIEIEIAPIISLFTSILIIGYASALISFDTDTSVANRRKNPDLYGYVSNESRNLILLQMVTFGALQCFNKVLATALLWKANVLYLIMYLVFDNGLFYATKLLRSDFYYVTPITGNMQVFNSTILRLGMKLITDFTGMTVSKSPSEIGGIYWCFNMGLQHTMTFIATEVFITFYDQEEE
jgi:hypothetical protein